MNAAQRAGAAGENAKCRGSVNRSRGWKTRRWSPAAASSPATSISRISCTCAWCARRTPTAASSRSICPRRGRCPACSRCGVPPTSPTCRRSIFARAPSRRSIRIASRSWPTVRCAMSASRSPRCSPKTLTSPKTPPISSRCRSRNCRRSSTRRRRRWNFRRATAARRRSSARAMATSMRCSARPSTSSKSSLPSAGIPACRWRPAAPSAATTPRAAFSNCTAPPRCRIATRNCCRACSRFRRAGSMSTSPMSAAASASAASFIPRTCWSASPRKNSIAR